MHAAGSKSFYVFMSFVPMTVPQKHFTELLFSFAGGDCTAHLSQTAEVVMGASPNKKIITHKIEALGDL